jgi:hypothetical protein
VLDWAWRTDSDKIFMRAVTDYAQALGDDVHRPMAFPVGSAGPAQSLGGGALERSEVIAALSFAEKHWHERALPHSEATAAATEPSR